MRSIVNPRQSRFSTKFRIFLSIISASAILFTFGCSKPKDNVATTSAPNAPCNGASSSGQQAYNPANAISMPDPIRDAQLTTIDGKSFKLTDYSGKVVVLNLWATWCVPCRAETPELISLSNEFKDKGVEVIGVATKENEENGDGVQGVKDFVRGYKVPYQMVYTDHNFAAPLLQMVNAQAIIPQSFVISREGKFIAHFRGFNPELTPTKMHAVVEQAASECPKG
jgi:thiol-disulfide isomerase/thioredoxin